MSSSPHIPELELLNDGSCESTIIVFGPHVGTIFTKEHVEKMVRPLATGQHREWILEAIADLPQYWDALLSKIPEVADVLPEIPKGLADLDAWFRHGSTDISATLPRPVLGPVVVLTQLTQYWQFLELTHKGDPTEDVLASRTASSTENFVSLGFCAGLIPTLAAASAHNREEFQRYAAVAMRVSMLIGGLIDAREVWDKAMGKGGSVSLATAWTGEKQAETVRRICDELSPDAYVAIIYDEARATVKSTAQMAPLLQKRLRAAGIVAIEMDIGGHVHSPDPNIQKTTESLVELANSMPGLQYADLDKLALPTYDNHGEGRRVLADYPCGLTELVIRGMFVQQCQWYGTFTSVITEKPNSFVVNFGPERCVPQTWMRKLGTRQVHFEDIQPKLPRLVLGQRAISAQPLPPTRQNRDSNKDVQKPSQITSHAATASAKLAADSLLENDKDSIAVIGMSIKTAGANDLAEFADMIKTGESQHVTITRDRMMFDMLHRDGPDADPKREWYGCFVRDPDAFDHKFFKRSPREAAAMDPQGRQALETAYQAVEQSGYFQELLHGYGLGEKTQDSETKHVGVYLGSCGVDYDTNACVNEPSAFTATGVLKGFIAGRISHYFGWTGPSMSFDTACSSSVVAIHTACRNLLSGECTAALAGGSQGVSVSIG